MITFGCAYHCWQDIPDYSVYNVLKGAQLQEALADGIIRVSDIPDHVSITGKKSIDVDAFRNDEVYVDKESIREFLKTLEYPLYFLDYETIYPAIPLYDKASPYQQIPFQFSLHIQNTKGSDLKHIEFLHTEPTDPRPSFINALINNCGRHGSVVVYNRGFEARINRVLGETFPRFASRLEEINARMVDLLVPFRSRHLYHPKMKGSASIKNVLPAFVPELNYDDLEINDGGTASMVYLSCVKGSLPEPERENAYRNLREYCGLDTLAEVKLIEILYKHAQSTP